MIFDSAEMQRLRERYGNLPSFRQPKIIRLDCAPLLAGERAFLENLMAAVPDEKRKDWLGRLLSDLDDQHAGAWFEIMLFSWLRNVGTVAIEPDVEGNRPDFVVSIGDQQIAIEAQAHLLNAEERERKSREDEILWILRSIQKPAMVTIEQLLRGGSLDAEKLIAEATQWLDGPADESFLFQDNAGNRLRLTAHRNQRLQSVATIGPTTVSMVNSVPLQRPLRKKAGQHQALRGASHPYIIAVWLEDVGLTAEEVAEAWFGKTVAVIDTERNEVIEERLDGSGAHFCRDQIKHTSVTGTLVFRENGNTVTQQRELSAWYIQNPFARVQINPFLFPAETSFVVIEQNADSYAMGWRRRVE